MVPGKSDGKTAFPAPTCYQPVVLQAPCWSYLSNSYCDIDFKNGSSRHSQRLSFGFADLELLTLICWSYTMNRVSQTPWVQRHAAPQLLKCFTGDDSSSQHPSPKSLAQDSSHASISSPKLLHYRIREVFRCKPVIIMERQGHEISEHQDSPAGTSCISIA